MKAFSLVKDPLKEISYDTHKEAMKRAQKRAGVKSSKVTHFGRGSGARAAELAGASEDGIRRSGRWEQGAMSRCYLSRLPLETMRVMGGFAAQRGNFYIKREIAVPEDLVDQIFPEAKVWYDRHQSGEGVEVNIAAGGFLKLLLELRSVFVQDSVLLRKQFPKHFVFQHPIFESPQYRAFERRFDDMYETLEEPSRLRLDAVLPDLTQHIDAAVGQVVQIQKGMAIDLAQVAKQSKLLSQTVVDVLNGTASVQISALWPSTSAQSQGTSRATGPPSARQLTSPAPNDGLGIRYGCDSGPSNSSAVPPDSSTAPTTTINEHNSTPLTELQRFLQPGAAISVIARDFKMSRAISSVEELWREYDIGLGSNSSVRAMYELGDKSYKKDDAERKFFQRRRIIIDEVKAIADAQHISPAAMALRIDLYRRTSKPVMSLSALETHIKQGELGPGLRRMESISQ